MRALTFAFSALLALGTAAADIIPPPPSAPEAPAPGVASTPDGFVRDLYEGYFAALNRTNENPDAELPPEYEWDAIADRTFTPELAARFKKALNADEPVIDWDFFISGQDFSDLKVLSVEPVLVEDTQATVKVVAENTGRSTETTLYLEKRGSDWRIADFLFSDAESEPIRLTDILKEAGF